MEELYSLDSSTLHSLKPVYGLIFLFKWLPGIKDNRSTITDYDPTKLFFARQVITNACATQAILAVLLNIDTKDVELGDELREFKEVTKEFDAEMKGLAISNRERIRDVHNSFNRPEPFLAKKVVGASDSADLYHFIAYLPVENKIYELDGMKNGPIILDDLKPGEDWLLKVTPHIQSRIEQYSKSEIRFNLMGVIRSRIDVLNDQISAIQKQIDDTMVDEEKKVLEKSLKGLQLDLENEKDRRERWRVENVRRKHNYVPFIVKMIKMLADKGELLPLIERATS